MAKILYLIIAFFIISAFTTSEHQADGRSCPVKYLSTKFLIPHLDKLSQSSKIKPVPTILHQSSKSKHHKIEKHNNNPLSSLSNHFSTSNKSLSGTNLCRWFHQFRQVLTDGCSYVMNYGPRIYRFLNGAKYDEREERAQWEQLTVGFDAAQRAAIGATLNTISTMPNFTVLVNRTAEQKTKDGAARVGMRLDEVPYPALWLEGLVRSTEGLPSLPSPPSWPDVVSLLSPFSWWARFWRWWWRRTVSWTWMMLCLTGGALYLKLWRGLGVRSCLEILGCMMVICYMCSIHTMVEAVCSFFLD